MGTSGEVSGRRVENAFLMKSGVIPKSGSPEGSLTSSPLGSHLTWRLMGSGKWGYESSNRAFITTAILLITLLSSRHEPPGMEPLFHIERPTPQDLNKGTCLRPENIEGSSRGVHVFSLTTVLAFFFWGGGRNSNPKPKTL